MSISSIGILGAGAVGGMLAALLSRSGYNVLCINRGESHPIIFESPVFGTIEVGAPFVKAYDGSIDILLITVKSPGLIEGLKRVEGAKIGIAIPLLNGVGHAEVVRKALKIPVAVGMIGSVEVVKRGNIVRQASKQHPNITLASSDCSATELIPIADIFKKSGIHTDILKSEGEVVWGKLVRLNAVATLTAAFRKPVGLIRTPPLRSKLIELLKEGSLVAEAAGVTIDWQQELEKIDNLPENLTTSLARDISAGVPSELDVITGGVYRIAVDYGIRTPTLSALYKDLQIQHEGAT